MLRCPRAVERGATAALAHHETSSSARSRRCRAVTVDRSMPFPENGASV